MQLIPRANEARICAALGLHVGVQSMWLKANSGSFRSSRDPASRAMSSASSFAPPLLRPFDPLMTLLGVAAESPVHKRWDMHKETAGGNDARRLQSAWGGTAVWAH